MVLTAIALKIDPLGPHCANFRTFFSLENSSSMLCTSHRVTTDQIPFETVTIFVPSLPGKKRIASIGTLRVATKVIDCWGSKEAALHLCPNWYARIVLRSSSLELSWSNGVSMNGYPCSRTLTLHACCQTMCCLDIRSRRLHVYRNVMQRYECVGRPTYPS